MGWPFIYKKFLSNRKSKENGHRKCKTFNSNTKIFKIVVERHSILTIISLNDFIKQRKGDSGPSNFIKISIWKCCKL